MHQPSLEAIARQAAREARDLVALYGDYVDLLLSVPATAEQRLTVLLIWIERLRQEKAFRSN
jgi:hypothetical protein